MCDECRQNPCANTCPNNPDFYKRHYKTCPVCLKEYNEEDMDYAVCDSCIALNTKFDTAIEYGNKAKTDVYINGFFAKVLTQDQIDEALLATVMEFAKYFAPIAVNNAREFIADDVSDFADWLKEREEKK